MLTLDDVLKIEAEEKLAKQRANNSWVGKRRYDNKLKSIHYLGGKCKDCSGEFHPACYDFHHHDPSGKEVNVGTIMDYSWQRIQAELDKCELLCSNCHRIRHAHSYTAQM